MLRALSNVSLDARNHLLSELSMLKLLATKLLQNTPSIQKCYHLTIYSASPTCLLKKESTKNSVLLQKCFLN